MSIYKEDGIFTEFEMLIIDRTATSIAQLLMREFYIKEKRDLEDVKSYLNG